MTDANSKCLIDNGADAGIDLPDHPGPEPGLAAVGTGGHTRVHRDGQEI